MLPRVLLVHPPFHAFTAYDFWMKPLGLLGIGGALRGRARLRLFDFLDRVHPGMPGREDRPSDRWGRGAFHSERRRTPAPLASIPRRYRRFGVPRERFREFLAREGPFDFALVQAAFTYGYLGAAEVFEDLRAASPGVRIALGGFYPTACPGHALGLGADLVVTGDDLAPLWGALGIDPVPGGLPFWEGYPGLEYGVLRLSRGCPFRCTYCSAPRFGPPYEPRPLASSLAELDALARRGVRDFAFYDDALLHRADEVLLPFLEEVRRRASGLRFHTPNALHARLLGPGLAESLVRSGFATFYLGFEGGGPAWREATGGKVSGDDLAAAVENLVRAGADPRRITVYLLLGHPTAASGELEEAMRFVRSLGIRQALAEFSPVPGTPDGDLCGRWVDLFEPLWHDKTAFPIARLGFDAVARLKGLCREFNREVESLHD